MLIATKENTKTVTDLRERAVEVLNEANKVGLIYVLYNSRPRAVLIDIDEFIAMQEMLEDYLDIQEARKLSKEPKGKPIPLEKIKEKYL